MGQPQSALEAMIINAKHWQGRRVLLTGHTGFKGGWLALWLQQLGANVCGLALAPAGSLNLHSDAKIASGMVSHFIDLRDATAVKTVVHDFQPEIVFHLAAQPLVLTSYLDPIGTYATNVMGTIHLLEAIRALNTKPAVVLVTTDKCYENHEWTTPYREEDQLGGIDPYSSSKACMEIVAASWRRAFPDTAHIATARAGNVIGGGDWAEHRIIPDAVRAFSKNQPLIVRNPESVRPWQHVLEPLSGYLLLAQSLLNEPSQYTSAWNFGPAPEDTLTVAQLCNLATQAWPQSTWQAQTTTQPHEAGLLKLDSSKAMLHLGWLPRWQANEAISQTLAWYRARQQGQDMHTYSLQQIQEYLQ